MATPAKTVQFRNKEDLIRMYDDTGIAAFSIKMSGNICFKYDGDSVEDGGQTLRNLLQLIINNQSAGIYTLCLYDSPAEGSINDKTPCGYAWNFRFSEFPESGYQVEQYKGSYGQLVNEMAALKKEVQALRDERESEPESKLGVVGEIMEMEAVKPLIMGIANKIADWITGPEKVGELKRVSGIGTADTLQDPKPWQQDRSITAAIDRLIVHVPDLGAVLSKMASVAENSPKKFKWYMDMVRSLK